MSRSARRKQKIEYEPDPVISPPKPPTQDESVEPPTQITRGGIREIMPDTKVGPTTARHQGITELMERAARIAEHNPKPKVIGIPSVKLDDPTVAPEPTLVTPHVIHEDKPLEPIDDAVPGYGNVFGAKEKRVKHT